MKYQFNLPFTIAFHSLKIKTLPSCHILVFLAHFLTYIFDKLNEQSETTIYDSCHII